jgi:hypothetical protein
MAKLKRKDAKGRKDWQSFLSQGTRPLREALRSFASSRFASYDKIVSENPKTALDCRNRCPLPCAAFALS